MLNWEDSTSSCRPSERTETNCGRGGPEELRLNARREKGKELDDLRAEFVKLDGRLREVSGKGISGGLDLTSLRNLDAGRILGVGTPPAAEEISQLRRRFASAFHSNRANQLPDWVSQLFDQLLGIVNEACDRIRK